MLKLNLFLVLFIFSFTLEIDYQQIAPSDQYLSILKKELTKEWPENKTINLVFHGHSVPAGYFNTPIVNSFGSYPLLVLKKLKEKYPNAVINVINTSIGGENSVNGEKRFKTQVLTHNPDILFIDYALNDRSIGIEESRKAWEKMIKKAFKKNIHIILLTPSPDLNENLSDPENRLEQHAEMIRNLAKKYTAGLADSYLAFLKINNSEGKLEDYMAQNNHPNEKGHTIIANEIMKYFK